MKAISVWVNQNYVLSILRVQNDKKVYKQFMETVNEYLEKYMPVEK